MLFSIDPDSHPLVPSPTSKIAAKYYVSIDWTSGSIQRAILTIEFFPELPESIGG